ncbi:MAG TPA: hypothetical protein VFE26_04640 [Trebonia sp.]|nr:hypothetical protein [Trebonia sp.]
MKTGIALGFICIGAILAFAVTGNTSVFNIHTAGWVIMLVGLVGLFLPRRNRAWLGRRVVVRRTRSYPGGPGGPVEEIPVPPYVARNPGTARIEAGLPARPTLMTEREPGEPDLIADAENQAPAATQPTAATPRTAPQTEIIEDLYENPE